MVISALFGQMLNLSMRINWMNTGGGAVDAGLALGIVPFSASIGPSEGLRETTIS
ncbi:MAG: hypothetical protein KUL86_10385 [Castellaniella sp.]|nr:hypothetical protein [Castellaniella sp.]